MIRKRILLAACLLLSTSAVMAEPYVAVGVGYSFGQKLKSVTGNENTNYPDPPDPTSAPLFPDSKVTDLASKNSINLSTSIYPDFAAGAAFF